MIRQRGSRAQGHDDYSAPRNNHQEVPAEYAHDPDLYYAIQASLQIDAGSPQTQDNSRPAYDGDDRNDDLDKKLNTSSTADGNRNFDISFESRNKKMDEIAFCEGDIDAFKNQPEEEQERPQPAAPRLTLEQERQEDMKTKRVQTKDKFEAAK